MADITEPIYGTREWAMAQTVPVTHKAWSEDEWVNWSDHSSNYGPGKFAQGWCEDAPQYDTGWSLWQEPGELISDMPGFDEAKKAHTERIFGAPEISQGSTGNPDIPYVEVDVTGEPGEVDLTICPACGGPADNGHDREVPPNPYYCDACQHLHYMCVCETDHADDRDHLIARQQLQIEDLKKQLSTVAGQHQQVYNLLFNIGAPLNDNRLEFNLEQRRLLHEIKNILELE